MARNKMVIILGKIRSPSKHNGDGRNSCLWLSSNPIRQDRSLSANRMLFTTWTCIYIYILEEEVSKSVLVQNTRKFRNIALKLMDSLCIRGTSIQTALFMSSPQCRNPASVLGRVRTAHNQREFRNAEAMIEFKLTQAALSWRLLQR